MQMKPSSPEQGARSLEQLPRPAGYAPACAISMESTGWDPPNFKVHPLRQESHSGFSVFRLWVPLHPGHCRCQHKGLTVVTTLTCQSVSFHT